MRVGLVTTTIHVPRILELLRRYDPDVRFFIAGDEKMPEDAVNFCTYDLPNTKFLFIKDQQKWKCSEIIGWNCIQRRNIALLEALEWGAEVVVYWDDDNLPIKANYFRQFQYALASKFDGLQISSRNHWFNQYGVACKHRGFPIEVPSSAPTFSHVLDVKVGVAAGICLGNPDIDAYARMANPITLDIVGEMAKEGYAIHPNTHVVFNSQNTAFLRQFAPAMFMAPGIGRADDIFASLLVQRIMKDTGYQVHIGPPFTYQERNPHDLLTDLKNELFCMENILEVSEFIDRMNDHALADAPIAERVLTLCRYYYGGCAVLPQQTREAGLAFLEDIEAVMK